MPQSKMPHHKKMFVIQMLQMLLMTERCISTEEQSDTLFKELSSLDDSHGSYSHFFNNKNSYIYRSNQENDYPIHLNKNPQENHHKREVKHRLTNNPYQEVGDTDRYKNHIYRSNYILNDPSSDNFPMKRNADLTRQSVVNPQPQILNVPSPQFSQYPPQYNPYAPQVPLYGYPYAQQQIYPGSPAPYIYSVSPSPYNNYQDALNYPPTPLPFQNAIPYGYYGSPTPLPYHAPSPNPYALHGTPTPSPQYASVYQNPVYRYSPTPYPKYPTTPISYPHPSPAPEYRTPSPIPPVHRPVSHKARQPLINLENHRLPPQIHKNVHGNKPEVFTSFVGQHHMLPSNSHTNRNHGHLSPSPLPPPPVNNQLLPNQQFREPQNLPIPTFRPKQQFNPSSTPVPLARRPTISAGIRSPFQQRQPVFRQPESRLPANEISLNQGPTIGPIQQQRFNQQENGSKRPTKEPRRPKSSRQQHKQKKSSRALDTLLDIAGEDWNPEDGIVKNLLDSKSSFVCPGREGHFPDPDSCSVYYQCAHGTATRNTCQEGLMWNMVTNQCDWQTNVDCRLNRESSLFAFSNP